MIWFYYLRTFPTTDSSFVALPFKLSCSLASLECDIHGDSHFLVFPTSFMHVNKTD